MNRGIYKNRKIQIGTGMVILIILLLLLKGCSVFTTDIVSIDDYTFSVESLMEEEEEVHEELNDLLSDTTFEDLCTNVYTKRFTELGNRFIDIDTEFNALEIEGDKNTKIPKYQWYVSYFSTYEDIGNTLVTLSDTISRGKYTEAVEALTILQSLNQSIPTIE
jgi:hypothetical protein